MEAQDKIRTNSRGLTLYWKEVSRGRGIKSVETESDVRYTAWKKLDEEWDYRFKDWTASWATFDFNEVLFVVPKGPVDMFVDDLEKISYLCSFLSGYGIFFKVMECVNNGISGYKLFIQEEKTIHVGYRYYNIVDHSKDKSETQYRRRPE